MSDPAFGDGRLAVLLLDLFRSGNDDTTVAEWLNDHYRGDAPLIIEMLVTRVRALSATLAEQMNEWADLLKEGIADPEGIISGLIAVARDIDPERAP